VSGRTVVFVCAHGAARSRLAAAWFNTDPPPGWRACTAAGEEPAETLNPKVGTLLTDTPAGAHLDKGPPIALSTVDGDGVVVAIDCATPAAYRWDLDADTVGEAMRDELRDRVAALVHTLRHGSGEVRS
jgi:arsenate reductase (thioredoxin)